MSAGTAAVVFEGIKEGSEKIKEGGNRVIDFAKKNPIILGLLAVGVIIFFVPRGQGRATQQAAKRGTFPPIPAWPQGETITPLAPVQPLPPAPLAPVQPLALAPVQPLAPAPLAPVQPLAPAPLQVMNMDAIIDARQAAAAAQWEQYRRIEPALMPFAPQAASEIEQARHIAAAAEFQRFGYVSAALFDYAPPNAQRITQIRDAGIADWIAAGSPVVVAGIGSK